MEIMVVGRNEHARSEVVMDIDGENKSFVLVFRYQYITQQWTMTIRDEEDNELVTHIPLISGVEPITSNLLRVYAYQFLGSMVVFALDDELFGKDPTKDNLKSNYCLAWSDSN